LYTTHYLAGAARAWWDSNVLSIIVWFPVMKLKYTKWT
jgi:hypothetical protein